MRWQTTLVAVVLLALLAGFYFYDVKYLGPEREKTDQAKNRIWMTVEPKDVEEVVLKRQTDVVRLQRTSDGWQMVEPVQTRAAGAAVDDVVTTLVTAKMDREVAQASGSLDEFGLDKPVAEVTVKVKDRADPLRLDLGGKNPTGVWVYAKKPEAPAVLAVSESLLRDATKSASEFRDRTLLTFDRKDVTALEVTTREETIAVESRDGAWRIVKPVELPADADAVSDLIDKLQFTRIKDFVADAPPSLTAYGLDNPTRVTVLTGKDKDRAAKTILLGRADTAKQGIYAMRPGESSVLLLPGDVSPAVPRNVGAVRDKTVVAFDREKLVRIQVDGPKGTVVLERQGEKDKETWRITAPENLAADQAAVGNLLMQLHSAKAQGFLGDLRVSPTVKVSLWERGADAPKVVGVAPSPDTRGGKPSAYATSPGQGQAVLVDARLLADMAKSATDLRDRTLLAVDPRDVGRLRVKAGDQTVLLERSGETAWKVVEPKRGDAKGGRADELLTRLRGVRWTEVVSTDGGNVAAYGLDAPAVEITLFKRDGAELGSLQVGKQDGDRTYVRVKGGPAVYTVPASQLADLPRSAADFQG